MHQYKEIVLNKFLLLVMFLCPPIVAAEPIFQSLRSCTQKGSATNNCSVVLDDNGYMLDAGSGKKLSDTAEPTGALNSFELYRDGSQYILANEGEKGTDLFMMMRSPINKSVPFSVPFSRFPSPFPLIPSPRCTNEY